MVFACLDLIPFFDTKAQMEIRFW